MTKEIIEPMEENGYFLLEYKVTSHYDYFKFAWDINSNIEVIIEQYRGGLKAKSNFYINTDIEIPTNEDKLELLYDDNALELLYCEVDDIRSFKKTEYPKLQELMKELGIRECKN